MKQLFSVLSVAVLLTGSAMAEKGPGHDQVNAPGIDKRIERQKKRIEHKLQKGKINAQEAEQLNKNVDEVRAKEATMSQDGKLSKEERKELHQDLKKNSEAIKKK